MASFPRLVASSRFYTGSLHVRLATLLFIALAAFLIAINDRLLSWGDSAMYLMHARNLVAGVAYNATGYIQNPNAYLAPQAYPPGFPLALAPVYALFGLKIAGLKIYTTLIYWLAVVLFIGSIRRDLVNTPAGCWAWLGLIPIIGCNPMIVRAATPIYSDGFFLLTLYAALWGVDCLHVRHEERPRALAPALWVGILAGLCATTRIFGLLLLASIPVFELLRYRRLTRPGLISVVTAIGVYGVITLIIKQDSIALARGSQQGYGHLFLADLVTHAARLPATISHNVHAYIYATTEFLILEPPWLPRIGLTNVTLGITLVGLLIGLIGYIACVIRRFTVKDVFCVIYILGLLPWMAHSDRYLLPVVPMLLFYIVVGLRTMTARIRLVFPLLLAAGLLACGTTYATDYSRTWAKYPKRAAQAPNGSAAMALYRYIDRHTSPNAVFVCRKPRVLNLYTHRSAATYADDVNPTPPDPQIFALLGSIHANYLLVGPPMLMRGLPAFVARHASRFELVYQNAQFKLYRLRDASDG